MTDERKPLSQSQSNTTVNSSNMGAVPLKESHYFAGKAQDSITSVKKSIHGSRSLSSQTSTTPLMTGHFDPFSPPPSGQAAATATPPTPTSNDKK